MTSHRLVSLAIAAFAAACGDRAATGSAHVQVSIAKGLSQADIAKVTVTVSGLDMSPISVDLPNTNGRWEATFGAIPAGLNRSFKAEAFDSANAVHYRGTASGITITRGGTAPVMILAEQTDPAPHFGNAAPIIDAVVASAAVTAPGGVIHLTVTAHDPDGPSDPISYAWSAQRCVGTDCAPDGALSAPIAAETDWTAGSPAPDGARLITITVTDSHRASTSVSFALSVSNAFGAGGATVTVSFNSWPLAIGMTAAPTQVAPGGVINLSVTAQDPDGDALSADWASPDCTGSFSPQSGLFPVTGAATDPQTATTAWTSAAPSSGNQCTVIATVTDGRGGTNTATAFVFVETPTQPNFAPQIDSFLQSAPGTDGSPVTLTLNAHDPDTADTLSVTWATTGGSLTHQETGSGATISTTATWTPDLCSPSSPLHATVTIDDGHGASASHQFNLIVPTQCPASCAGYQAAGKPSGAYPIDPAQTHSSFNVYCSMEADGAWMLIGKLGSAITTQADFLTDVAPASLLTAAWPAAGEQSRLALHRFDGYGDQWTVRVVVDTGDQTHFQYSFWRPNTVAGGPPDAGPADAGPPDAGPAPDAGPSDAGTPGLGVGLTPGEVGTSWKGNGTAEKLLLNNSSTASGSNDGWISPPYPNEYESNPALNWYLFGYSEAGSLPNPTSCLGGDGKTQECRNPAGILQNDGSAQGTNTAFDDLGDGLNGAGQKSALYWIKLGNAAGAP